MPRYFFQISFKGSRYSGWQRQSSAPSIQHSLEDTLTKVLRRPTTIHGCGRTDAGVHASQYFFHLDVDQKHNPSELIEKVNRTLPSDIVVHKMHAVENFANAQKNAISRTYQYFIHRKRNPFLEELSYFESEPLNLELIEEALPLLVGRNDFRNFCKSPEKNDNCICILKKATLRTNADRSKLMFEFTGNRFLHNMIRLLVGNLLKIGRGSLKVEAFQSYLELTDQPKYFDIAYPNGLYLAKISYPFLELESPNVIEIT